VSGSCALPPKWPPQCSCVVIESSFDLGERLQAPGSLLFSVSFQWWRTMPEIFSKEGWCQRAGPPDTILEEAHPMTILSKFGSNWATGSRQEDFMWISHRSYVKLSSAVGAPISTKLCWNDSWVILFQKCVRHFKTPTKMATTAELNLT
jgi:hypothetical protein